MTPPEGTDASPPAVSVCTMKTRAQFLAANHGHRQGTKAFMLQARDRADGDPAVNIGFTCSKKVGNAVARNRAKRRLREIARQVLPHKARPGWDYVLIGRRDETAQRDFGSLLKDLDWALDRVHGLPPPDRPRPPTRRSGGASG